MTTPYGVQGCRCFCADDWSTPATRWEPNAHCPYHGVLPRERMETGTYSVVTGPCERHPGASTIGGLCAMCSRTPDAMRARGCSCSVNESEPCSYCSAVPPVPAPGQYQIECGCIWPSKAAYDTADGTKIWSCMLGYIKPDEDTQRVLLSHGGVTCRCGWKYQGPEDTVVAYLTHLGAEHTTTEQEKRERPGILAAFGRWLRDGGPFSTYRD